MEQKLLVLRGLFLKNLTCVTQCKWILQLCATIKAGVSEVVANCKVRFVCLATSLFGEHVQFPTAEHSFDVVPFCSTSMVKAIFVVFSHPTQNLHHGWNSLCMHKRLCVFCISLTSKVPKLPNPLLLVLAEQGALISLQDEVKVKNLRKLLQLVNVS